MHSSIFLCACDTPVKKYEPAKIVQNQLEVKVLEKQKEYFKEKYEIKKRGNLT